MWSWDILRFDAGSGRGLSGEVKPRIYVDCTQTLARPVTTGIPRVVRSIVRDMRDERKEDEEILRQLEDWREGK
jgi:hypothetical protein